MALSNVGAENLQGGREAEGDDAGLMYGVKTEASRKDAKGEKIDEEGFKDR